MLRENSSAENLLEAKDGRMGLTQEVAHFVARTRYRDIPKEVVQLARGFILDGLGVALAGSTDECARIVQGQIRQMNGALRSQRRQRKRLWPTAWPATRWITTTPNCQLPKKLSTVS
jgi:hypothetical protein